MDKRKKLAVFDLDGTLFDTAEVNYRSYQAAAAECGYQISRELFMQEFVGKNYKEFLAVFGIREVEIQERIHEIKKERYDEFLYAAKKNEHLFSMISCMKPEYVIALATTASERNAREILTKFGVEKAFDIFITQESVIKLKPDPECYLLAMKKADALPKDTVIFEDSDTGAAAAAASGALVLRVENFSETGNIIERVFSGNT